MAKDHNLEVAEDELLIEELTIRIISTPASEIDEEVLEEVRELLAEQLEQAADIVRAGVSATQYTTGFRVAHLVRP